MIVGQLGKTFQRQTRKVGIKPHGQLKKGLSGEGSLDFKIKWNGFPGGAVVENLPANAGDMGSSPGLGGSHMPRSN